MPMFSNAKYHSVNPYRGYLAYLFQVFTDSLSDLTLFSVFMSTELPVLLWGWKVMEQFSLKATNFLGEKVFVLWTIQLIDNILLP